MASVNLVTSHKGENHITVDNVRDLIAGISGEISGIKIFPQLDDGMAHTITDILEITVKTGQALAGGYHFQLLDDYVWVMDSLATGYSRIDLLYLVIYQDNVTLVQTADFIYIPGTAYQNGTAGTEPSAPTGTNILETFKFMRVDLTDGAIVSLTDYSTPYLSNTAVKEEFSTNLTQIQENTDALNGFRFGIDGQGRYGYKKVGADTVTPFRQPSGTAVAANVLTGKTFSNSQSDNLPGTMPNNGAVSRSLLPGESYTVPEGYHSGSGKVTATLETWTDTFPIGIPAYLDCSNIKSMTVTNGQLLPAIVIFKDKNGNSIGSQTIMGYQTASLTFPSTARYVDIDPDQISAVTVVYQTKILRGQ